MGNRKYKVILFAFCALILLGVEIFFIYKRNTFPIKAKDVASIEVTMDNSSYGYYSIDPKFTVVDKDNIDNILKTLLQKRNGELKNKYDEVHRGYNIIINMNDGDIEEYSLGTTLRPSVHMQDLLQSEEVVKQIRTAFTIDMSTIDRVEYYFESEDDTDAVKQEIQDKVTIDKIIKIAQEDALENADSSMDSTTSGIQFSDKDGNPILVVNISEDMEGYDNLVELLPQIEDHVK